MSDKNQNLPRRLIRLLKDIMAGTLSSDKKRDYILRCIHAAFASDTVSLYRMNPHVSQEFILVDHKGIRSEGFYKKILSSEDGILSALFQNKIPVYIEDLSKHPKFGVYKAEFKTILGIPLLRGGRCIGALFIKHKERKSFSEEEIEYLETVAITLSEIVVQSISQTSSLESDVISHKISGISLSQGIGIGKPYFYKPENISHKILSDNPSYEIQRLKSALDSFNATLEETLNNLTDNLEKNEHLQSPLDILKSYHMFSQDKGWIQSIHDAINTGLTAESSLEKVLSDIKFKLLSSHESFAIEFLYDIEDVTHRLLSVLVGDKKISSLKNLDIDFILVAKSLGPAELLDYTHPHLKGIILEEGSATSHVAIIGRALGIPILGWTSHALTQISEGSNVIVDATSGFAYINPAEYILNTYTQEIEAYTISKTTSQKIAPSPSTPLQLTTKNGVPVSLLLNAGLSLDLNHLSTFNADGIGLFRTEIPFMLEGEFPDVPTQTRMYKKIFDLAQDKPILFRILDIGGDKPLPYFNHPENANPLLGWRALRILLDRPSLLKHQIRSLIRAAQGKDLYLMFPMVSEYVEFELAKKIVHQEIERELSFNRATPNSLKCGITLEVPALAWQLPKFIQHVDFISIGSNDLFQFFFASDRCNPQLYNRYDVLSPGFLSFLKYILDVCRNYEKPISLCGEMASHPIEALALIGIGFRTLSLNPSCFLSIKKMIQNLDVELISLFLEPLLSSSDHSLRKKIKRYAHQNLGLAV
ncbi:MAG: phosphoenolpyruvate--protein phosphotransferase [Proteobacteria bacterium]|nr:phosphoenolpyruvate--protein phosphotransferase [Pseudomonadota bacterium]